MFGKMKRSDIVGKRIEGIYEIKENPDARRLPFDPCIIALESGVCFELPTGIGIDRHSIKGTELPSKHAVPFYNRGGSLCHGVEILEVVVCPLWASIGLYLANGVIFLCHFIEGEYMHKGFMAIRGVERAATYPWLSSVVTCWGQMPLVESKAFGMRPVERYEISRDEVVDHRIVELLRFDPLHDLGVLSNPIYARLENGIIVDTILLPDQNGQRRSWHLFPGDFELSALELAPYFDCRGEWVGEIVSLDDGHFGGLTLSSGRILANDPICLKSGCPVCLPGDLVQEGRKITALHTGMPLSSAGGVLFPAGPWPQRETIRRQAGMRELRREDIVGKKVAGVYQTRDMAYVFVELEDGTAFELHIHEENSTEPFYAVKLDRKFLENRDDIQLECIIGQTIVEVLAAEADSSPNLLLSNRHSLEIGMTASAMSGEYPFLSLDLFTNTGGKTFWEREEIGTRWTVGMQAVTPRSLVGRKIRDVFEAGGWDYSEFFTRSTIVELDNGNFVGLRRGDYWRHYVPDLYLYDIPPGVQLPHAAFLKTDNGCIGCEILDVLFSAEERDVALLLSNQRILVAKLVENPGNNRRPLEEWFCYLDKEQTQDFLKTHKSLRDAQERS